MNRKEHEEYIKYIDEHISCGEYLCDYNFNGHCINDDMNNHGLCIMDIISDQNVEVNIRKI